MIVDEFGVDGGCDIFDFGSGWGRNSVYLVMCGYWFVVVDYLEVVIVILREICYVELFEVLVYFYDINDVNFGEFLFGFEVDYVISMVVF